MYLLYHHHRSAEVWTVDRFSLNGDLMFTASSDGAIFVMDGRPSKKFAVLGYVRKLDEPYFLLAGCNTFVSSCDGIWYTGTMLNWNSLPNNLSGLNIINSICLSGFNIALTMYLECFM